MFEEINAQMMATPKWVQLWMNWMTFVFLASVFFVKNHRAARWVLASYPAAVVVAMGIFALSHTVHLFGVAHYLIWGPLLVYLYRVECKGNSVPLRSPYGIWLSLLFTTIVICLAFDARDIVLVAMGAR